VRAVAEAVGKSVTWDGKTSTVYLGKTDGQTPVENLTNLPVFEGINITLDPAGYIDNTGALHQPAAIVGDDWTPWTKACTYLLNSKYSRLKGNVSLLDDYKNTTKKMYLTIKADGKLIYTSGVITAGSYPQNFDVDVSGVTQLRIEGVGCNYAQIILSGLDLYN
jgi:hypothetical protein